MGSALVLAFVLAPGLEPELGLDTTRASSSHLSYYPIFVTSFPGVLCEVSFLRWGVRKLPAADLATTPGALWKSSQNVKVT